MADSLPDSLQGLAILTLWKSGLFDSADISRLLSLHEAHVARTVHAARSLARAAGQGGA